MKEKRPTEHELLKNLDAFGTHADELAKPRRHESDPLGRLKGSVEKCERPTDPAFSQKIGMHGSMGKAFQRIL
ncbi:hypothetical protein [Marinobacter sp. PE14]